MRTNRRTLYLHASTLWGSTADTDPRSARYETAEERLSRNVDWPIPARQLRWFNRLHLYELFWQEQGRTARENTRDRVSLPDDERRLGEWARYQRRNRADLCIYQSIRLDASPAFEWDPQTAAWNRNLKSCLRFLARTGGIPILDGDDPEQFALARWLGRQVELRRLGLLPKDRSAGLDALLRQARTN